MTLLLLGHSHRYEMECVLRLFYPGAKINVCTEGDAGAPDTFTASVEYDGDSEVVLRVSTSGNGATFTVCRRLPAGTGDDRVELALAELLYELLSEQTGLRPPWGILTGVRPARLYRTLAADCGEDAAKRKLERDYLVSHEKIDLLAEVSAAEQRLLEQNGPGCFSLYVSIPFCPSRCLYCSFVSHDITGAAKLVPNYVKLLCEEIRETGKLAARQGLRLQTVYVGGGTPTSLSAAQLEAVMAAVADSFETAHLPEYTVEAGRPDTVTAEKLAVIRRMGADRVSINPQTMDDRLLRSIGRNHTAAQTVAAYVLAREAGFPHINMDLIAGLPKETAEGFGRTLDQVLALEPDNITVHTLTVKRSSRLREREGAFEGAPDVSAMLDQGRGRLREAGYRPYYLYRQKGTVQNLENVGYARPGHEGLYNVLIMEEVQTILAVGAGAVTKLCGGGKPLKRVFNYKYPYEYIDRFDEVLRRKSEVESILEEMPWR